MTELECLGLKYDTDKVSHGYCPHYERLLGDIRFLPITMIEIGVAGGASLRMWRDWMPRATICGFDQHGYNGGDKNRFKIITGDQSETHDLELLAAEVGRFHLVIDDGSHNAEDQQISFNTLWPKMVSGGWYVIEDSFGIGSCLDLEAIARNDGDIKELHLFGGAGDVILFLKKR